MIRQTIFRPALGLVARWRVVRRLMDRADGRDPGFRRVDENVPGFPPSVQRLLHEPSLPCTNSRAPLHELRQQCCRKRAAFRAPRHGNRDV